MLVADPKTRFALTAKSTVSRAETIAIYAREIDAAYAAVEEGTSSDSLPDICDHVGILKYIRQVVSEIAGKDVPDEADLFDSGEYLGRSAVDIFDYILFQVWIL